MAGVLRDLLESATWPARTQVQADAGRTLVHDGAELVRTQRAAADLLRRGGQDRLIQAARLLAATLHDVVGDDELWAELAAATTESYDRERVAGLILLDWTNLLATIDYRPPPPREMVAWELAAAASSATGSGSDERWADLRILLANLASQLDDRADSRPSKPNRRWWRSLRDKVGVGYSALRRISLMKVLTDSLKDPTKLIAEGSTGVVFGTAFGPVGAIIGAGVAGLATATMSELREELRAGGEERDRSRLATMLRQPGMTHAEAGRHRADLKVVVGAAREVARDDTQGSSPMPPEVFGPVADIERWAAALGIELANAWGIVAAHAAKDATPIYAELNATLGDLRVALNDLRAALERGEIDTVKRAAKRARRAIGSIPDLVAALSTILVKKGAIGHPSQ